MISRILYWTGVFLFRVALIVGLGAVVGAITFPLAGLIFGFERSAAELALSGIRSLGFLFFIWAPGISLVLCVRQAYQNRNPETRGSPDSG